MSQELEAGSRNVWTILVGTKDSRVTLPLVTLLADWIKLEERGRGTAGSHADLVNLMRCGDSGLASPRCPAWITKFNLKK